jgi:hypothetical protein
MTVMLRVAAVKTLSHADGLPSTTYPLALSSPLATFSKTTARQYAASSGASLS